MTLQNQFIVVIKWAEGFWNKVLLRKRVTVYLDGEEVMSFINKGNQAAKFWFSSGTSELSNWELKKENN